jgi:hypothetical protein
MDIDIEGDIDTYIRGGGRERGAGAGRERERTGGSVLVNSGICSK